MGQSDVVRCVAVAIMAACTPPRREVEVPGSAAPPAGAMARVHGATFAMGSPEGEGEADEHPQRTVTVASFEMDVSEVTVAAYGACVEARACTPAATSVDFPGITPPVRELYSRFCNGARADRIHHPVNCVSFAQAAGFCAAQGKRLPTEEEWEYAAKGGALQRKYPWGAEAPSPLFLNVCGKECNDLGGRWRRAFDMMYPERDAWEATAPVGSFPAGRSAHGLVDMAGNVWEWTSTAYSGAAAGAVDPRVIRGGCWLDFAPSSVRGAYRNWLAAAAYNSFLGFRCARDVMAVTDGGAGP